jgi:hypothetical protein
MAEHGHRLAECFARFVMVTSDNHMPAGKWRPIGFGWRSSAVHRRDGDQIRENARRTVSCFLAFRDDRKRIWPFPERWQIVERSRCFRRFPMPAKFVFSYAPVQRPEFLAAIP